MDFAAAIAAVNFHWFLLPVSSVSSSGLIRVKSASQCPIVPTNNPANIYSAPI